MQYNWMSYQYNPVDGYGRYGTHMIRALAYEGAPPHVIAREALAWDGSIRRLAGIDFGRLTISLMIPDMFQSIPGRQWGYTMTESTGLPDGWAENINLTCERLIVPADWLIDVFRNAGVLKRIPIHVIPGGIDPDEFPLMRRDPVKARPFTFLALGDRAGRKGDTLAHTAFMKAFLMDGKEAQEGKVRFVMKSRPNWHRELDFTQTPSCFAIWRDDVKHMADVFAMADCFVFPSFGEGWGMPPREAAATGMPVIATNAHGLMEGGLENWAYPLTAKREATNAPGLYGDWWACDVDEIAAQMRWVYEHQQEAFDFGRRAAAWLRDNQTWQHSARKLLALIGQYG